MEQAMQLLEKLGSEGGLEFTVVADLAPTTYAKLGLTILASIAIGSAFKILLTKLTT